MILTLVATLSLLVSIISAFLGRNVRPYIYVCIISLVLFFSIYFNLAPVEIAQDLDNYFAWYSNINFVENEGRTDFGFSLSDLPRSIWNPMGGLETVQITP